MFFMKLPRFSDLGEEQFQIFSTTRVNMYSTDDSICQVYRISLLEHECGHEYGNESESELDNII